MEIEDNSMVSRSRGRRGRRKHRQPDRLDEVISMLTRIDTALIVRDPGSARSADAFEGLRRQVVAAASDRRQHLVQLTELAEAVRRKEDLLAIASRSEEWLLQANIVVVTEVSQIDVFELVGQGEGTPVVTSPAYLDGATGAVVRRGIAERQPHAPMEMAPPTEVAGIDQIEVLNEQQGDIE